MNTETIYTRRGFVKLAAGAVAAAVVVTAGGSSLAADKALAATVLPDGTYKVNANVFISKDDSPIGSAAYLCNLKNPLKLQGRPTSPVTGTNATLVVSGGNATITLEDFNECIAWVSCSDRRVTVLETVDPTYSSNNYPAQRIQKVKIALTGQPESGTLTPCEEYAALPIYKGKKTWDVQFTIDYSMAVSA